MKFHLFFEPKAKKTKKQNKTKNKTKQNKTKNTPKKPKRIRNVQDWLI